MKSLPFPELFNDLIIWSDMQTTRVFNQKVFRIYVKCLLKGKTQTAIKISEKYREQIEEVPDEGKDVMFGFAYHLHMNLRRP